MESSLHNPGFTMDEPSQGDGSIQNGNGCEILWAGHSSV